MSDEVRDVETRIAAQLAQFTSRAAVERRTPAPYVRRHAVEHAAAGGVLDERFVNPGFLPFVDADRLRSVPPRSWAGRGDSAGLLRAWRQVAHATSWDNPLLNRAALGYWGGVQGLSRDDLPEKPVSVRWTSRARTQGEILARIDVHAVATGVLPDGRLVAVTGSADGTVRVWDLTTGTQIGNPLTGHTHRVQAVATGVLPDGRLVAVTDSDDGTVRVWDLATGRQRLVVPTMDRVEDLAICEVGEGWVDVVLVSGGLVRMRLMLDQEEGVGR